MRDASEPRLDGPGNLLNAVTQVFSSAAYGRGVTVTLNGYLNTARDIRKTQTTNLQTFTSGGNGQLANVSGGAVRHVVHRVDSVRLALLEPLPDGLPDAPLVRSDAVSDGRLMRYKVETGAIGSWSRPLVRLMSMRKFAQRSRRRLPRGSRW